MTRILIARHGNTFDKGETPLRVGLKTDLPLSSSGKEQALALGKYLLSEYPDLTDVFTSQLQRTIQTASIALGSGFDYHELSIFNEIDYGVDEAKPESEVIARIGQKALDLWDEQAIPPFGWIVDPGAIRENWVHFAQNALQDFKDKTILVVTSNGIARFAPVLLKTEPSTIKLSTGAISSLVYLNGAWQTEYWNKKPA